MASSDTGGGCANTALALSCSIGGALSDLGCAGVVGVPGKSELALGTDEGRGEEGCDEESELHVGEVDG